MTVGGNIKGLNMAGTPESQITYQVRDLLSHYNDRVIRVTTDWQMVLVGNLRIQSLDWRWFVTRPISIGQVIHYDPWDWLHKDLNSEGVFRPIKYELSGYDSLNLYKSYSPLWEIGTEPNEQIRIMRDQEQKMKEHGSQKCKNGIVIAPESPLWDSVDLLATVSRNSFREQMGLMVHTLNEKGVKFNDEELWNAGTPILPKVYGLVQKLNGALSQMSKTR